MIFHRHPSIGWVVLLDLDDPAGAIHRPAKPFVDETVYRFYRGGDHVIGLATDDFIDYAHFE